MRYSEDLDKLFDKASDNALNMDSTQVCASHIVEAALDFEYVYSALEKSGVNMTEMVSDIHAECDASPKIGATTANRYKVSGIRRQMRLSSEVQNILLKASKLAENEEVWKTNYLEMSHLMMSVLSDCSCKTLNKHLNGDSKGSNSKLNKFLNELINVEANERGIAAKKLDFTLERNSVGSSNSNAAEPKARQQGEISPFCRDLVAAAENDDKPFVGRQSEVAALMQCLERRDKPNAILVGAPGVGKTDIVRGLARKIANGDVPEQLANVSLYSVDIPGMLAGSEFRGSFEKRLKETIEAACKQDRPILFIDEIHTVLGAGKAMDSSMDAANILKPYLTEGKIRVVGATTNDEYRKYVEKDAAFMRRFQQVDVSEPTPSDTVKILEGIKPAYEVFHSLKINKDAIKAAVDLSVKHMHDRFLPDKAIDIVDQTCARVKIERGKKVTVSDIEITVADLCHVPTQNIQKDEMSKVRELGKNLKSQVFGQDEAIDMITEAVQMSKAGLCDETKPIGAFLFVGPSGVGKTEVSKQLAANLGIEFIRFDMSEYAESHTIAKLIGSPAGYVGYDDGGILVEKVRQRPNSVILFDEIEKAHPDIYKIFLQIFDYGMLTDNKGRKADFRNTVIIMTSNAGNTTAEKQRMGFGNMSIATDLKSSSMKAVKELMAPELRGRITATVVFNPLNQEVSRMIVNKELKKLKSMLKAKSISVTVSDAAVDELVKRGISAQYGAREIQRVIDNDIKKMFVKVIISGNAAKSYNIDVVDGQFAMSEVGVEDQGTPVVI